MGPRWACLVLLITLAVLIICADGKRFRGRFKDLFKRGRDRIKKAEKKTIIWTIENKKTRTPVSLFNVASRLPNLRARERADRADELEQVIDELHEEGNPFGSLTKDERDEILVLAGCKDLLADVGSCSGSFHKKYRTTNGTCNNLGDPDRGAALTAFRRLAPPEYENGVNLPKGWTPYQLYNGFDLPSGREVSLKMISCPDIHIDNEYTEMIMQWGQFIDHDITFSPKVESSIGIKSGIDCGMLCYNDHPCFPIQTPKDDPRIPQDKCMGTIRSAGICNAKPGEAYQRQQLNAITAYIDASQVYGSSVAQELALRDYKPNRGYLRVSTYSAAGKPYLPLREDTTGCQPNPNNASEITCFLSGDGRMNEQLALTALHTVWLREHNRIVDRLWELHPYADPEFIYQEARKIVGAKMQVIHYKEWLPKVLGKNEINKMGRYNGYDPTVDASIANEFAGAAYRFGHGLIRATMFRLDENYEPNKPWGNLPMHQQFFTPYRIIYEGGIDPPLRGMFGAPAKKMETDRIMTSEVTEKLFAMFKKIAFDLGAMNIQRGRDHGLPSYNAMREKCGLKRAKRFSHFRNEISEKGILNLEELYGHPDNVDLWVGGMSEDHVRYGMLGPTFSCIITDQFRALRDGDRFWYENSGIFTPEQVQELSKASLARVLCDNGDNIRRIQPDAFKMTSPQDMVSCDNIEDVDLNAWGPDEEDIVGTIKHAHKESCHKVEMGIWRTKEDEKKRGRRLSPGKLFSLVRTLRTRGARHKARLAEIIDMTIEILRRGGRSFQSLTKRELNDIFKFAGIKPPFKEPCSDPFHQSYRTANGTCNNLDDPDRGAAETPLRRLAPAEYEDGILEPKGWNPFQLYNGYLLPSPREVSIKLVAAADIEFDSKLSEMVMQFGQFLDHDMAFSPHVESEQSFESGTPCEDLCANEFPCFYIPTPKDDPRIPQDKCIGFTRSAACTHLTSDGSYQRQQINVITAFIDGSQIYGNGEEEALSLRELNPNRGYLRVGDYSEAGKPFLPNRNDTHGCLPNPQNTSEITCFQAGDGRVNEQLALAAMHTLWMREHNRIVDYLWRVRPNDDPDIIYHEARKIVGAELQHITYSEWLPKVLGEDEIHKLGYYNGYDKDEDPSIINSFSTAAFRMGHTIVRPTMFRLDDNLESIAPFGNLQLHEQFFASYKLLHEGGIDPLMRGMFGIPAKKMDPDHMITSELTEKLFSMSRNISLDLAALNIQRGRDHGLPNYNAMRERCGLPRAKWFSELSGEFTKKSLDKLEELYGHPDNIDLFVGGIGEIHVPNGKLGPTFSCILREQFKAARDGDRFWYENPGIFTWEQCAQIKKASLSRVLCDNGDNIRRIQPDAFHDAGLDQMLSCDHIDSIDLSAWATGKH